MSQVTTCALATLFEIARAELASGKLTAARLDELERASSPANRRQCLLYLHANTVSLQAHVLNATLYEPDLGKTATIDPTGPQITYATVKHAIVDGWRVIQFPDPRARFDDREIDLLGYEFILEKYV